MFRQTPPPDTKRGSASFRACQDFANLLTFWPTQFQTKPFPYQLSVFSDILLSTDILLCSTRTALEEYYLTSFIWYQQLFWSVNPNYLTIILWRFIYSHFLLWLRKIWTGRIVCTLRYRPEKVEKHLIYKANLWSQQCGSVRGRRRVRYQ